MPSLSEITRLPYGDLQETLQLEPNQKYARDEPDHLMFMTPTVAIEDADLREGGANEIGAKELLGRVTKRIIESGDSSLFEVPEITSTHLGYAKQSRNKENRRAITNEEGKHWLEMLSYKQNSQDQENSGAIQDMVAVSAEFTPEDVETHLSGLKEPQKGSFLLLLSIFLIFFEKTNTVPSVRRTATVGLNKISDFLVFWTLPFLMNYSSRKVQEIIKHGKRTIGENFSIPSVETFTVENVVKGACQDAEHAKKLLSVFKRIIGTDPIKEEYCLINSEGSPIIFIPIEYQVTKMPARIEDLGRKETWQKLGDVKLAQEFIERFVEDRDIQRDFFHDISQLKYRQGIDFGIILPDEETFAHFVNHVNDESPDCLSESKSIECRGIKAKWAVIKSSKTDIKVCFSFIQGMYERSD